MASISEIFYFYLSSIDNNTLCFHTMSQYLWRCVVKTFISIINALEKEHVKNGFKKIFVHPKKDFHMQFFFGVPTICQPEI